MFILIKIKFQFLDLSFSNLIYLCVFFTYFIFSFIYFFSSNDLKTNILIITVPLIVSLYLFETYSIFNGLHERNYRTYKKMTGKNYDKRSKYEIYQDLKNDSSVRPGIYTYQFLNENSKILPLSSFPNKKIIYCNENGYYVLYQSDRYGFNNQDLVWDREKFDFILIGDSFTNGACVTPEKNIAGNLNKITNSQNILNLGIGGGGPMQEYAIIKEYLPTEKKINRLLWIYYEGNDLGNLVFELDNNILNNYLNNNNFSQNLKSKNKQLEVFLQEKIEIEEKKIKKNKSKNRNLKIINFILLKKTRNLIISQLSIHFNKKDNKIFDKSKYQEKLILDKFREILSKVKKITNDNEILFYFIYIPDGHRYIKDNNNIKFQNYSYIKNLVNDLKIKFIDINKIISIKYRDPLKLYAFNNPGAHFNEQGYNVVSKIIFDEITKMEK